MAAGIITGGVDFGAWVDAADLTVGEAIWSFDGDYGIVESIIVIDDADQRMYNLTVNEAHTFFVGDGEWLVHNCTRGVRIYGEHQGDELAELDYVSTRDSIIIENKDGRGITHPRSTTSPEDWAEHQIYQAGGQKIKAIQNGQGVYLDRNIPTDLTIEDLQRITHFEFNVLSDDPNVIRAVNNQIERLGNDFGNSGWTFSARFGVNR